MVTFVVPGRLVGCDPHTEEAFMHPNLMDLVIWQQQKRRQETPVQIPLPVEMYEKEPPRDDPSSLYPDRYRSM
jgi:hypothetical protein